MLLFRNGVDDRNDVQSMTSATVSYDLNGGSWTTSTSSNGHNAGIVASNLLGVILPHVEDINKTGYTLNKWFCVKSNYGNGTAVNQEFDPGTTVPAGFTVGDKSYSATFQAIWTANTYTVSYNSNGGVGTAMSDTSCTYDVSFYLSTNTYTRTGYTFQGWATSQQNANNGTVAYSNGQYVSNLTATNGATVTLYAVWKVNMYSFAFYANGGNGSMPNQVFSYGSGQTLAPNVFTKEGYHFAGWATSTANANAGVVEYSDKDYILNYTSENNVLINLYAVWAPNSYSVSYLPNSGFGGMTPQTFVYDVEQELTANAFTKTGYTFIGWATTQQNADMRIVAYEDCEAVSNLTAEEDGLVTLYAVWKPKSYYVEFNSNGGVGTMLRQEIENEVLASLTANAFTKDGYTFVGWATTLTGANKRIAKYADEEEVINLTDIAESVVNLYAVWEGITYYLEYDGNGGDGFVATQKLVYGQSEPISKNGFKRENYVFKGWASSKAYADAGVVQYAEREFVSNLSMIHNSFVTLYAVWEQLYIAKYDTDGGYWYVEMGKTPQKRVSSWFNSLLNSSTLVLSGNEYNISRDVVLQSYLYHDEEYCVYNNQWYHVEPIRWRLSGRYEKGDEVDVASAILAQIVYVSEYSDTGTNAYSDYSVGGFMNNIVHDEYYSHMPIFVIEEPDVCDFYSNIYVASKQEIQAIAGSYDVPFSDLVCDFMHDRYYFTRTHGTEQNLIAFSFIGLESQRAPEYVYGVQYVIRVHDFVVSA